MTSKQCNSCANRIYAKKKKRIVDHCFLLLTHMFMKSKVCPYYTYGEVNEAHKNLFKRIGREYPLEEIK